MELVRGTPKTYGWSTRRQHPAENTIQLLKGDEMLEMIGTAILRKVIFMVLIWVFFRMTDITYFKAFNTDEEMKGNAIAISILYAGFFIALAIA